MVAFSSGNHAQAVAIAARWLGCRATIVMPRDAPRAKLDGTRAYGAEIVLYDRERDDREAIAARLAAERGAALVPPFDHAHVIAGQGTAALELGRALALKHVTLDALYTPCSGGGLVAGSALAIKSRVCRLRRLCGRARRIHEARGFAAGRASGSVLSAHPPTLCDGLRAPAAGAITFAINRRELAGAVAVDDDAVLEAMALAAEHLKVVLEPSGAAGARRSAAQPATGSLRRRDPLGRQRRRGIIVERRDAPRGHADAASQSDPCRLAFVGEGKVRQHLRDGP